MPSVTTYRLSLVLLLIHFSTGVLYSQSVKYIPYRTGGKWVISNTKGEHLTQKLDYEIYPATVNRIRYKDGEKYGYLRSNGSIALPAVYKEATDFSRVTSKASVILDEHWFHIDIYGDTTKVYAYCGGGSEWYDPSGYKIKYGNKYRKGLDFRGREILPPIYKDVTHPTGSDVFFFQDFSDKFGVVNTKGDFVFECALDSIQTVDGLNAFYFVVHKEGKMGAMNSKGSIIAPLKYDKIVLYSVYGLCFAAYKDEKFLGYVYNGKEYWEVPSN